MRAFRLLLSVSVFAVVIACGSPTAPGEFGDGAANGGGEIQSAVAEANRDVDIVKWDLITPAPEGMTKCVYLVKLSRRARKLREKGQVFFSLRATKGEAQTSKLPWGIVLNSGIQPGCDVFKGGQLSGTLRISDFPGGRLKVRINHHAHIGSDCSAAGNAVGSLKVVLRQTNPKNVNLKERDLKVIDKGCS